MLTLDRWRSTRLSPQAAWAVRQALSSHRGVIVSVSRCATNLFGCSQDAPAMRVDGWTRLGPSIPIRSTMSVGRSAQSSISSQTACSSCSSQSAPGSATAQLVHVPIGRAGRGPDSRVDDHAGRELDGRAQRGRRHPPVRRWIAGSDGERDARREFGAEPKRERVGRSVVADGQQRLGFVRRLRLLERDQVRVRRPQPSRLGARVSRPRGDGSSRSRGSR